MRGGGGTVTFMVEERDRGDLFRTRSSILLWENGSILGWGSTRSLTRLVSGKILFFYVNSTEFFYVCLRFN